MDAILTGVLKVQGTRKSVTGVFVDSQTENSQRFQFRMLEGISGIMILTRM